MSAFGGKADMAYCSAHAYDPKRTWGDQEIDGRVLLFRRNPQGRKISSTIVSPVNPPRTLAKCERD